MKFEGRDRQDTSRYLSSTIYTKLDELTLIENQVHWTLDVTFNEDKCRIRSWHSPRNFGLLRRLPLNALNQESTYRRSLRQKSKRAAMDNDYMVAVLSSFCQA